MSTTSTKRSKLHRGRQRRGELFMRGAAPLWLLEMLFDSRFLSPEASRNPDAAFSALVEYVRSLQTKKCNDVAKSGSDRP